MTFVLTASVLFLFTLLVPAFAGENGEEKKATPKHIERLQRQAKNLENVTNALKAEQKSLQSGNVSLRERLQLEQEILVATREHEIALQKVTEADYSNADASAKAARAIRDLTTKLDKLKKSFDKGQKAAKGFVEDLAGIVGVSTQLGSSIMGSFVDASKSGEAFQSTLNNVRAEMKQTFNMTTVGVSMFSKLVEATVAVATAHDKAISSFIRATGATQDYGQVMESVFMSSRQIGVSMEEAGQAVQSLYTGMASFSTLSETVRTQLTRQVALMNEVGISTDSAASAFDTLTKVMHRTPMEAARISEEMVNMAERIGLPPARLIQEFSAASSQLAKYGDQMTTVFMELQGAAKATGMALGELVGIASQFDTFYGAAEAAGRLNSILGGPYLNSIELLNANEQERIRLLIQSVEVSGRSWESMNRFERQAVAAAAGINDMAQASRIFGQSLAQYDQVQRTAERGAAAQQELAARAAEAQTVFEMMANIGYSFAIAMRPVVEVLKDVMQWLAKVAASDTGKWIIGITAAMVVWKGVILALGAALAALMSPLAAVSAALAGVAYIFTKENSPTFSGYIKLAATYMGDFAGSIREALGPSRALNNEMAKTSGYMTSTVSGLVGQAIPSLRALNNEMASTASGIAATAAAASNAKLGAAAGGLAVVRVEESSQMRSSQRELINEIRHWSAKLHGTAAKDTVLKINNREFGRATKNVFNREMGRAGSA